MIPQCNPKANYKKYREEIDKAISTVLSSGSYVLGEQVTSFEDEFSSFLGISETIGVANGTDAIELALRACKIGNSDLVATVSHTAVATVSAIRRVGAKPIFVDIEEDFYTMSPKDLAAVINEYDIKAIIVVHIYGQMADMQGILDLAKQKDIPVIEDCAQAHGATQESKMAGTWGDIGCFSFYPTKNLGAIGDAGAVVTNNMEIANRLREIRQYGWKERYISIREGINSRLDEIQAAVLRVKLKYLSMDNNRRKEIAAIYNKNLENLNHIIVPKLRTGNKHVYHQYVILSEHRDTIRRELEEDGIFCGIHYPKPVHLQSIYHKSSYNILDLNVTEQFSGQILSLPMYPELNLEEAKEVTARIKNIKF